MEDNQDQVPKTKNYIELFSRKRESDQKNNILFKNTQNPLIIEPKAVKHNIRSKQNSKSVKKRSNNSLKIPNRKPDKETPRFSLISNSSLNSGEKRQDTLASEIDQLFTNENQEFEDHKIRCTKLVSNSKVSEPNNPYKPPVINAFLKEKTISSNKKSKPLKNSQNLNEMLNITFNNSENHNVLSESKGDLSTKAFNQTFYGQKDSNLFSFRESHHNHIISDLRINEGINKHKNVTSGDKVDNLDIQKKEFIDKSLYEKSKNPFFETRTAILTSKKKNNFIQPSNVEQDNPADISFIKSRNKTEHLKFIKKERLKNAANNQEYSIKSRSPPESYKNSFYQVKESASVNNSSNSDNSKSDSSVIYDKEILKKNIVCLNKDNIILNRNTKKQYVKQSKAVQNKTKRRSKDIIKQENETFRNELTEILNSTNCSVRVKSPSLNRKPIQCNITEPPHFFLKKKKDVKEPINIIQQSLDASIQPLMNLDSLNNSFYNNNLADKYRAKLNFNGQNVANAYYFPGYQSNIAKRNKNTRGNSSASDSKNKSSLKDSFLLEQNSASHTKYDNKHNDVNISFNESRYNKKMDGQKAYHKFLNRRKLSEPDKHLADIRRLQNEIYNDLEELKKDNFDIKKKNRKMLIPGSLKLDILIEKESVKNGKEKDFNSVPIIKKDNIVGNQEFSSIVIDKDNILSNKEKGKVSNEKNKRFNSFDKGRLDIIISKQKSNLNKKYVNTENNINFDMRKNTYDPPIKKSSDIINKKVIEDLNRTQKKPNNYNIVVVEEYISNKNKSSTKKSNFINDEVIRLPGDKRAQLFNQSFDFYNPIEAFKTKTSFANETTKFKGPGYRSIRVEDTISETNENHSRVNNRDIYEKSKERLESRKKAEYGQETNSAAIIYKDEVIKDTVDFEYKSKQKMRSPPRVIKVIVDNSKQKDVKFTRFDK